MGRNVYYDRIVELKAKHGLSFTHNPGGGEFYRDDLGSCQIEAYGDDEADLALLLKWLHEKGLE